MLPWCRFWAEPLFRQAARHYWTSRAYQEELWGCGVAGFVVVAS